MTNKKLLVTSVLALAITIGIACILIYGLSAPWYQVLVNFGIYSQGYSFYLSQTFETHAFYLELNCDGNLCADGVFPNGKYSWSDYCSSCKGCSSDCEDSRGLYVAAWVFFYYFCDL